jgi:hypothetical protein
VWPPSSPDLNPQDCYEWGQLKYPAYAVPFDKEESLHRRIVCACQTTLNYPGIFERMWRSMFRRVELCTETNGGRFEHLL